MLVGPINVLYSTSHRLKLVWLVLSLTLALYQVNNRKRLGNLNEEAFWIDYVSNSLCQRIINIFTIFIVFHIISYTMLYMNTINLWIGLSQKSIKKTVDLLFYVAFNSSVHIIGKMWVVERTTVSTNKMAITTR